MKLRPLPEAISADWDIEEGPAVPGQPWTNKIERKMRVPTGDTPLELAIRIHEMGHAAFSPDRLVETDNASQESLEAAEEARVNLLLNQAGYGLEDLVHPLIDHAAMVIAIAKNDWRNALRQGVASIGSGRRELWNDLVNELVVNESIREALVLAVASAEDFFKIRYCSMVSTQRIAEFIDHQTIGQEEAREEARRAALAERIQAVKATKNPKLAEASTDSLETLQEVFDNEWGDVADEGGNIPGFDGCEGDWAPMWIDKPELCRALSGRWKRHRLPMEEGDIPRNMHRLPIDGRIFTHRVRKQGGTVLIDCSGSMSLTSDQILDMVKAAPGATVALYAGDGGQGCLKIVARKGYMARDNDIYVEGGNNEVDGPALEWLCGEEEPRLWVSDGYVTGSGDDMTPNLLREAERICYAGQIIMVPDPDAALRFLKSHIRTMQ